MVTRVRQTDDASVIAWIGLGANLGDPLQTIQDAIQYLSNDAISIFCRSSLWRSAPVGYAEQPDFINAVVAVKTTLASPFLLLHYLRVLEQQFGRTSGIRNGPRILDLDVLAWGSQTWESPSLTLPHPRLHTRAFVLYPLLELEPNLVLPGLGRLDQYLSMVADQRCLKIESV